MGAENEITWIDGQAYLELVGGPFCGQYRRVPQEHAKSGVTFLCTERGAFDFGRYVLQRDGRMWYRPAVDDTEGDE